MTDSRRKNRRGKRVLRVCTWLGKRKEREGAGEGFVCGGDVRIFVVSQVGEAAAMHREHQTFS